MANSIFPQTAEVRATDLGDLSARNVSKTAAVSGKGNSLPEILTVPDVARYLRISRSAAYELVHQFDFPALILGHTIRIRQESFLNWLEEQEKAGTKAKS
jgi:excisionase family DNA binding protein